MVKNPSAKAGDTRDAGLIPGSGRCPRGVHGNPLQYSCLENPIDKGAWKARVHEIERLLLNEKTPGFLASGGEEFNPRPETSLDRSELLCNILLKYKGDRESF